MEIAEGVFVTEAMWPELTGDFDPDYPGRIRYVPTGKICHAEYGQLKQRHVGGEGAKDEAVRPLSGRDPVDALHRLRKAVVGRIRYVPTGNEMMEVYDTSAIVAAWQAEDPDSRPFIIPEL